MHILIKMGKKIVWGLFFVLSANLYAEFDSLNVKFVGNWRFNNKGSNTPCIDTLRDLMFWPQGGGVDILDISNPSNIKRVSLKLRLGQLGDIAWLLYHDNKLFTMEKNSPYSFEIWNVVDVQNPYRLCHYLHPSGMYPTSVKIKDTLMYAIFYDGNLCIFDISGIDYSIPPQLINEYIPPIPAVGFQVINDTIGFLYHWSSSWPDSEKGVRIIDISDPLAINELAFWNEMNLIGSALLDSNYMISVIEENVDSFWYGILDISDIISPRLISNFPAYGSSRLEGYRLYQFKCNDTIQIWDISDVFNPIPIGEYGFPLESTPMGFKAVRNRYLYMLEYLPMITNNAYRVIDVSNPLSAHEVCRYSSTNLFSSGQSMWIKDTLAYVVSYGKVSIFDVSNPLFPEPVSEWESDSIDPESSLRGISIEGSYAYVTSDSGLHILDISNAFSIHLVGKYPGAIRKIYVKDDYVYAIKRNDYDNRVKLIIIDVSDRSNPIQAGVYLPPYPDNVHLTDIWVKDTIAYLGVDIFYLEGKFITLNVTDPYNPYKIGEYKGEETNCPRGIWVKGNYAYICNPSGSGLGIIDVSDPSLPEGVSCSTYYSCGYDLHVENNYLYSAYSGRLYIIDIHNHSSPTYVGYYYGVFNPYQIFVKDRYIYLPCNSGFEIYEFYDAGVEEHKSQVISHKLQVYPNPFVRRTVISYELPVRSEVSLRIYDVAGRCVKTLIDGEKSIGYYKVKWDGKGLSTGIYFAKFTAHSTGFCETGLGTGDYKSTKKLILMR